MKLTKFHHYARCWATFWLIAFGLYQAFVRPGPLDAMYGAVTGCALYAIWFTRERK